MFNDVVEIIQKDTCVSVNNRDIIVNCNSVQDAKCCSEVLDKIFNKGEAVVSIDYMDFISKSDMKEYAFKLVQNITNDNWNKHIREIEFSDNCKYIICMVGNITMIDATEIMEKVVGLSDKYNNTIIVYGLIYDKEYHDNEFNLYMWKEI